MNDKECYYTKIALKDFNYGCIRLVIFWGGLGGGGRQGRDREELLSRLSVLHAHT